MGGNTKLYESNVKSFVDATKEHYRKMTQNHLLCIVGNSAGASCFKIQITEPTTQKQMYTERAVNAFRVAMEDEDFAPMERIFAPNSRSLQDIKRQLSQRYGIIGDEPDEEMMRKLDNFRSMFM